MSPCHPVYSPAYRAGAQARTDPDAAFGSTEQVPHGRALGFPRKGDAATIRALADTVAGFAPGLVVLAGFMRILGDEFVDRFAGRLVNIHPSLLPKYRGLHTHRRALEAGDREHGASVHFVTRELDGGPVVLQARVPVRDGDDESTLAAKVLAEEHLIYPECIGWFAAGRLRMQDGAAYLDGRRLDTPMVRAARATSHG